MDRHRNWPAKIISIVFAIILWFIAIGEENPEVPKSYGNIPVSVRNESHLDSKELSLVRDIEDPITVRLRGRARDLYRIDESKIKGYIDLADVEKAGEQKIEIDIEGIPMGIRLEKRPEKTILIDKRTSKQVPVEVDIRGREATNYQMQPYTLKPDKVFLSGPQSLVDKIVRGRVSLDLKQSKSPIEQSLSIELLDENGQHIDSKFITMDQDFSIVMIPIYPKKDLTIEASISGKPAEGYEIDDIEIQPKSITVSGSEKLLNDMKSIGTELIDINDAKADIKHTVKLQKYDDIYLDPAQPSEVSVVVRIKKIEIEREFSIEIDVENLNTNRTANLSGEKATIVVKGHKPLIDKLEDEDIRAYVDLEKASRGEKKISIKVDAPVGVEIISIDPKEIVADID